MKKKTKKQNNMSVQNLLGIKAFSEYGLLTNNGELLFFHITPSNISVLSTASIEIKVRQLMVVLSSIPDIEIACLDSAERFDDNRAYLVERTEKEENPKVKDLLQKDVEFLGEIQMEMATARQFIFIARCRNMNAMQTFNRANAIQKIITEQGFDSHRMTKAEIKRFLALYFEASSYGEQMPDYDGEQYFSKGKSNC